jgi:hypothetical protein
MKRTLIGLGLIASLMGGEALAYKGFDYPGKKTHDFQSNPIDYPDDYYSNHSMGCLLLGECKEGVVEIKSLTDIERYYDQSYPNRQELNDILYELRLAGSKVFIAPSDYFPVGHRGVYHTVSNNFYLNAQHVHRFHVLMSVMRHEAWHAAQDCMGGTINNNIIALIMSEDKVPEIWQEMVKRTYPENTWPWEKEATWAGKTEGMTLKALKACNTGAMWEIYPPTPLTREYLIKEGYMND